MFSSQKAILYLLQNANSRVSQGRKHPRNEPKTLLERSREACDLELRLCAAAIMQHQILNVVALSGFCILAKRKKSENHCHSKVRQQIRTTTIKRKSPSERRLHRNNLCQTISNSMVPQPMSRILIRRKSQSVLAGTMADGMFVLVKM